MNRYIGHYFKKTFLYRKDGVLPHFEPLYISIYQPQDKVMQFCELKCDSDVNLSKIVPINAECINAFNQIKALIHSVDIYNMCFTVQRLQNT